MSLRDVFDHVAPPVRNAAVAVAAQLEQLDIRFALAGGLAVGSHGYVRATKDVDFLVGDEAFEHHGALVTFKPGVPIEVGGVAIDYLSPSSLGPQLEAELDNPLVVDGMRIVSIEGLVLMKLIAHRRRDQLDVVELVRAGIDVRAVERYLADNASDLLPRFELLASEAEED